MVTPNRIAQIAAAMGEPARAAMLTALMDGRALTASELAGMAGVTPQTASAHLARLAEAGLVSRDKQGRHQYHRLADASVAHMLEGLMRHAAAQPAQRAAPRTGPREQSLREARTCYDHLAGGLGVAIADALVARGHVDLSGEAGIVTEQGTAFLTDLGIAPQRLGAGRARASGRVLCRPCLDWSERRPHIAGRLGAALCSHWLEQGWVERVGDSRAVRVTRKGERLFWQHFGIKKPLSR